MSNEHLVVLDEVSKFYGEVTAVDKVSIYIEQGEFLVLLGPSGSGKTTLLSMMGGFTIPSTGRVLIGGDDVTDMPPATRPTVTVFQDYALFPHMSVQDNVGFGLLMRKMPKKERLKQVAASLEKVGLESFGDRGVHQLSGGQRQRVALARAIAVEPAVLLLDEPLGALDLKIRHQMQEELVHLQQNLNATFVHVTHDQEEAMSIADNIALINHGKIEDYGPPERIYLRPATLFTAKFMGETNIIEAQIVAREGQKAMLSSQYGEFSLPGDDEPGSKRHIALRPEQIKIGSHQFSEGLFSLGEAKVTEVIFHGTHKLCHMLGGKNMDTELLLRVPPDQSIRKDDMLELCANEKDAVLLAH